MTTEQEIEFYKDHCSHCDAKLLFGGCLRCDAPVCCPQCCKIDRLKEQLTAATQRAERAEAERDKLAKEKTAWQSARMEGRKEALEILMREDAETFADSYQGSSPLADTGDYIIGWESDSLRALFDVDSKESLVERLDGQFWKLAGESQEAEYQLRTALQASEAKREEAEAYAQRWQTKLESVRMDLAAANEQIAALKSKEQP